MCLEDIDIIGGPSHWQYPEGHSKVKSYLIFDIYSRNTHLTSVCYLKNKAEVEGEKRSAYIHSINPTPWVWATFPAASIFLLLRTSQAGLSLKAYRSPENERMKETEEDSP